MIKIVGTNHLMSKDKIYSIIKKEKPEIIGVELCQTRFNLLVLPIIENKKTEEYTIKEDKTIIGKISNAIKEKAEKQNLQYGSDMINACIYAKENNLPLEFLDMDITRTKELMEKIPLEEQQGFMKELAEFQEKTSGDFLEDKDKVLKKLKVEYPIAFEFLITIRDLFMLNKILRLERKYPQQKILVLVGDGHIEYIKEGLEK